MANMLWQFNSDTCCITNIDTGDWALIVVFYFRIWLDKSIWVCCTNEYIMSKRHSFTYTVMDWSSELFGATFGTYDAYLKVHALAIWVWADISIVIHNGMKHQLTTLAPTSFKESVYICVLCSLLGESISEVIFNIFLFKLISVPPGTYFMAPTYITA